MKKYLNYKNPWIKGYVQPILASIPMGAVAFGVYHGLCLLIPVNLVCLAAAILIAAVVYIIAFIFVTKASEEQLRSFPCGGILVRIGRMLKLYE